MLLGQTVLVPDSGTGSVVTLYTPWMPRHGDALTAVIEVMKASGAFTMVCTVETKDVEQPDTAATTLGATFNITAAGTTTALRSGCLELVRYMLEGSGNAAAQWVHFRSNAPQWQPN